MVNIYYNLEIHDFFGLTALGSLGTYLLDFSEDQVDTINQIFSMNDYAGYVWPCFGLATCIMVFMAVSSIRSLRRTQKLLVNMQESTISSANET